MNKQWWPIVFALILIPTIIFIGFGVAGPYLISAKNDLYVFYGYCVMVISGIAALSIFCKTILYFLFEDDND